MLKAFSADRHPHRAGQVGRSRIVMRHAFPQQPTCMPAFIVPTLVHCWGDVTSSVFNLPGLGRRSSIGAVVDRSVGIVTLMRVLLHLFQLVVDASFMPWI